MTTRPTPGQKDLRNPTPCDAVVVEEFFEGEQPMSPDLRQRRILVLDPIPGRGQAATSLLRRAGATVRLADSTLSAVMEARQLRFDRIILVGDPPDFGLETLLLALAANGVDAPVLKVDADAGHGLAYKLFEAADGEPWRRVA
jgi:hypothetical protein